MTAFDDLIANPFAQKRYLAILEPYDPVTAGTLSLHLGDAGFVTGPSETPANQFFEPRLVSALNFERHLFQSGSLGGRSVPGFGTLELNNADGGLDGWADYAFDGRRVRVWLGGEGFTFAEHGLIFDGTAEQIEFDDTIVRVLLRDLQRLFEVPVQASTYAGTGGLEGGDALKGKPKPLTFGRVFHVEPVAVDPVNLIYQVHDGAIEDVVACYDQGLALAKAASPPAAGQYSVDVSAGTLTLGTSPAGTITADVRGDKTGGTYVETAADLVRRIAVARGGFTDPDDLDTACFDALAIAAPAPVGLYIDSEAEIQDVLDSTIAAIGGHYGFDRDGKLTVGRLDAPSATIAASFDESQILELERQPTTLPIWRQRIGYQRYWRVLSGGDVAGAASDATKADLAEEYRLEEAEDPSVQTTYLLAEDDRRDTALALKSDAAAEASRLLGLFGVKRDMLRVRVKTQPFALEPGQTITITYPRHGLSSGRDFVIVGMVEDSTINEVTLDLWG